MKFIFSFDCFTYFYIKFSELLVSFTSPDDTKIQKSILDRLSSYCTKPVTDYREDEFVNPYQWTFYHCVFFSFIVCSTLGNVVFKKKMKFTGSMKQKGFLFNFQVMET